MKKKLGIIGGMGAQAGAWLFQRIITLSRAENDQQHLEIFLHNNTCVPDRTRAIVHGDDSPLAELQRSITLLNNSGVDVIVMACMTSYYYHNELQKRSRAEIIHPIPLILDELRELIGVSRVGVIGSTGLLKSRLFHEALEACGFDVLTLNDDEQEKYFMAPIYHKVKAGTSSQKTRDLFLCQLEILEGKGAEVIVGACSEVPLLIDRDSVTIPFIDVFDLLANKIVDYCYHGIQV
jgi:aspartate racemase